MAERQPAGGIGEAEAEQRVEAYTQGSDLAWVTGTLVARRDEVLTRWLDTVVAQPFHQGRRERAVADHIPALFDALIEFMQRATPRSVDPGAPLDDAAVLAAAQAHALARAQQGLQPADIVLEFRLLRQELWRAVRLNVPDDAPTGDIAAAGLLLNDALDGAIGLALTALTGRIEQLREEFVATTVHEVRQPITVILGNLQLADRLLAGPAPDLRRVRTLLGRTREATDRMGRLLGTLVDASRIALGGLTLQVVPADLAGLVRDAVEHFVPSVAGRVTIETPPGFATTGRWDVGRLGQVLDNLLSNAVKYSPPDTPIAIAIGGDAETVTIAVRDRGIGIAADDLGRLFGRYARARNALEQGIEGLGLGLYLCHGIITAHGGQIWGESPGVGRGTTLRITLPRRTPVAT